MLFSDRALSVGISGHQRLDELKQWTWVEKALAIELDKLHSELVAVTSLAIGADQLLARMVLQRGGRVHAVLPFAGIERSFSAEDVEQFKKLIASAEVETLDVDGTDEEKYLAAGKRVADLSDLLIAI